MTQQPYDLTEKSMADGHLKKVLGESGVIDMGRHPYYRAARAHQSLGRKAEVRGGECYLDGRFMLPCKFMAMVGVGFE
ncbi:hypothetical protein [Thalassospira marina]|uniref:Uncharacterized protein n=1 Tax=Thalassospira marina TaxID=2048283 RepID=A0A2N3KXX8_9PROT|nr:hypothetical protein [Thalassospira marina]PKR55424.1 hypothetical protein COO20_04435 [Thalassospira marina]